MSPLSLTEALADLPDPRSRHGRRFPLLPVLSLVTLGLLLGRKSLDSIARLGHDYGPQLLLALGFPRSHNPVKSTLSRLLRRLDPRAVESGLARWVGARMPPDADVLSLDGKTARGSRQGDIPGQHLVSAYAPRVEAVLGQLRVDAKTNEHKAALQLLGILPVRGKVVLGDAAFCQRDVAEKIVAAGGDYVFTVKANQPGLETDIAAGLGFEAAARPIAAAFSPGGAVGHPREGGHDGGQGPRPVGTPPLARHDDPDAPPEVAGPAAGFRGDAGADGEGQDNGGSRLRHHQPAAGGGRRGSPAEAGAGALADRELLALGTRHDAGRRRLPSTIGECPASAGRVAERGGASPLRGGFQERDGRESGGGL
jgi:hypothetical protein